MTRGGDCPPYPLEPSKETYSENHTSPPGKSQNTKEGMFPKWTSEKIPKGSGHKREKQHGHTLNIHWAQFTLGFYPKDCQT